MKKGYSKFLILWIGNLISQIGGGLTAFGLGVYVFQKTGSAATMAIVTLLGFLPTLLLSVPAGVLADMFDRRILMMTGDGLSAIGVLYILICMLNGECAVWQICLGVFVSSVFSSLLEPAYRSTITDLLTKEEFTKASGLVSLAGSARYLISPVIAGLLLAAYEIKLLLVIDICTFFVTIIATAVVKRGLSDSRGDKRPEFMASLKEGWRAVYTRKGVLQLIIISSCMSIFLGVIQVLCEPMILSFADSKTLGFAETVCALGMLVTALIIGVIGIKKSHASVLGLSLAMAGVFMICFSLKENIYMICLFGFMFFAMLPIANSSLDYLARTNIPDALQGRAWGFIGFLSQLGYIPAYGLSGVFADRSAHIMNISVGRGSAFVISIAGVMLIITSLISLFSKKIKNLETGKEKEVDYESYCYKQSAGGEAL